MMNENIKPWERPRVKIIIDIFGGHVVAIK